MIGNAAEHKRKKSHGYNKEYKGHFWLMSIIIAMHPGSIVNKYIRYNPNNPLENLNVIFKSSRLGKFSCLVFLSSFPSFNPTNHGPVQQNFTDSFFKVKGKIEE